MKRLIIDPPEGWRYGFPKECPDEIFKYTNEALSIWFQQQGYPKEMIDKGMIKYCRSWYETTN